MFQVSEEKRNPLSLSEVPEVSLFAKRVLSAKFKDPEGAQAQEFLKACSETRLTKEKFEEELCGITDSEILNSKMRALRQSVLLTLLARNLTGLCGLDEVVRVMSDFASSVITHTVRVYAAELAERFGVPHSVSGTPQDLLVIGMGKLGGAELNVSSDIDLIFFYDEDGECRATEQYPNIRKNLSNFEFFERLAKKIIPAISDLSYEGFVFRVDMRLRPNGDSGPIVTSCEMLEEYLMVQGREWERFAWLKGRVVNGPVFTTEAEFDTQRKNLADTVRPFVFRKYLDFGAISSLRDLHAKIRLASQRREQQKGAEGINIKLGRGGIREIEFIAQTFQIIRGGRNSELRSRSTLEALKALAKEGVLSEDKARKLSEIYVFLRNLEHALQFRADQQTQLYPTQEAEKAAASAMMGIEGKELEALLEESMDYVAGRFDEIFQTSDETGSDLWPVGWDRGDAQALEPLAEVIGSFGFKDPKAIAEAILTLMSQRALRIINPQARQRMIRLLKQTVRKMADDEWSGVASSTVLTREDLLLRYLKLLEGIAGRPTYVSLLLEYPLAARRVCHVLASGIWACEYLYRHPLLLDELLDERLSQIDDYTPVAFDDYIEKTRSRLADLPEDDQEARMNLIREEHHARLFRLLLADIAGRLSVERLADHLSALADATLEIAIEECWKTVPGAHREAPKFAIAAYGKLGGKELGYASDLDLVFIFEDEAQDAEKIYGRFTRRLINWLTATTSSGQLFDIDMRLRPNGESGMLVCSMEALAKYQRNEDGTGAWLWEHQALTRARFCAGDREIGEKFEALRKEILLRTRDEAACAQGILEMRQKMHDGHPNKTELFDIKHDAGGMVDVEFLVQYLVLRYSHDLPQFVNNFGNIKLLEMASDAGLAGQKEAQAVIRAYRRYRKLQHEFRLNSPNVPVRLPRGELAPEAQAVRALWDKVFGAFKKNEGAQSGAEGKNSSAFSG